MLLILTGLFAVALVLSLFPMGRRDSKFLQMSSFLGRFPVPLALATSLLSIWCLLQITAFLLNNTYIFNKAILGIVGLLLSLFAFEKGLVGSRSKAVNSLGLRIHDIRTFIVDKNYPQVIVVLLALFVLVSVVFSFFF